MKDRPYVFVTLGTCLSVFIAALAVLTILATPGGPLSTIP